MVINQEKYLQKRGNVCPNCESPNISGGPIEVDGAIAWGEVACPNCGTTWTDTWQLTGYCDLIVPDEESTGQPKSVDEELPGLLSTERSSGWPI